ncbi:MAG: MmcQ/YjbR family DNA-binding protein [Phycisphaerales bacterium]|nr:MmcQ/YjbR family DNA-binding protein [Phycisphaerales bacterium]
MAKKVEAERRGRAPGRSGLRRPSLASIEKHLGRVRAIALAMPGASERKSHGEPTFFVGKRVFAMMSIDHHEDGRLAVVLPLADGEQERLLAENPKRYYYPAYVGPSGWIGIHLSRISDAGLERHIAAAWALVAPRRLVQSVRKASVPTR